MLEITSLDSPRNRGDNFGALVRGYIEPPLDGAYRFYITGDDETQLLRLFNPVLLLDTRSKRRGVELEIISAFLLGLIHRSVGMVH